MAIAFDVAASTTTSYAASQANTTTGSYTIGSGSNRYAVGFGGTQTSAPAAATNLKQGGSGGTGYTGLHAGLSIDSFTNLRLFGLVNSATGSSTLYGDWAASKDEINIGSAHYTGVDQVNPLRNSGTPTTQTGTLSGSSTNCSITVTGTSAGDVVVAAFWADETSFHTPSFTAGAGGTLRFANAGSSDTCCAIVEVIATGSSTTVTAVCSSATTISGNWGAVAVALAPAGSGATQPPKKTYVFPMKGVPTKLQLFKPPRAAPASTNVTLTLSGQTATFTEGTLSPAVSYAPTGQTATFTEGTLSPSLTYSLSGQTATFAEGTISPTVTYGLTGQTATFSEGTITASVNSDITLSLSGQTATFSEGTLSASIDYSLTGQAATFSEGAIAAALSYALVALNSTFTEGALSPAIDYGLSAETATFTEGAITPQVPGDVTVQLSGLQAVFSEGQITVTGQDIAAAPAAIGSVPGFVPGAKKKKRRVGGPVMREDQVFGEQYPVSPHLQPLISVPKRAERIQSASKADDHREAILALLRELL